MTAPVYQDSLSEECEAIWQATLAQERYEELVRLTPPRIRLWDGDYQWQGDVEAEYAGKFT